MELKSLDARHRRKIWTGLGALLILAAYVVYAGSTHSVILAWDVSPDTNVTGYNLYYGGVSGVYTSKTGIPGGRLTNTFAVPGMVEGVTYYFAATATNSVNLESAYSTEVSYKVPATPAPPANLRIPGIIP